MIEVKHLSYSIKDKHLLDDISFSVSPGQLLAIVGANGAGKSTLLKILCKELKPSSGDVWIRQQPIGYYSLEMLAKFRSVLAQSNTISISFTAQEIVTMGRYPHFEGVPTEKDAEIVRHAMEETGVREFRDRAYSTLSGGEQQRVQLARVIAQIYDQPGGILFLDEPTNGLDLLYQQQTMQLARSLADRGYCVVCILHDINYASQFADNVLILKKGKRVAFGTPLEVVSCENIHEAFSVHVQLFNDETFSCPLVVPTTILTK